MKKTIGGGAFFAIAAALGLSHRTAFQDDYGYEEFDDRYPKGNSLENIAHEKRLEKEHGIKLHTERMELTEIEQKILNSLHGREKKQYVKTLRRQKGLE